MPKVMQIEARTAVRTVLVDLHGWLTVVGCTAAGGDCHCQPGMHQRGLPLAAKEQPAA